MAIRRTLTRVAMATFLMVIFGLSAFAGSSATREIFFSGNPVALAVSTATASRLR